MITVGDLLAVLRLRDEMTPAVASASSSLGDLNKSAGISSYQLTLLGRGLREAGVIATGLFTVPILGAAKAVIDFGGDFETVTSKLVSLAGVLPSQIEDVRKKILELAPATGIGPVALAEGMYAVSSTVSDTTVALSILTVAAHLSASGLGEVSVVARAITTVVNSYGSANISAAHAADVLTRAIQDGGAEAKDLAPVLANVVPFAAKMGVSFEQVAANFATITKLGVPASEAITQLTSVFAALSRETTRGETALKSVGMSYASLKDEIKDPSKGLEFALLHLKDAFAGNDKGLFAVLGRLEALKNVLGVTGASAATYSEEIKRMNDVNGLADKAFAAISDNFQQIWNEVKAELESTAIVLSKTVLPYFKEFAKFLRDTALPALTDLVNWFNDLPGYVKVALLALAGFLAALGPGVIVIGQFLMALGNIGRAFGLLGAGESLLGMGSILSFLANPLVLAGAVVIGGIAIAIYELNKNLAEISHVSKTGEVIPGMKDAAGNLLYTADSAKKASLELDKLKGNMAGAAPIATGFSMTIERFASSAHDASGHVQTLLEKVAALTASQRESIIVDKAKGLTTTEIAQDTGIAADVIGVFERQTAQATKTLTGFGKAQAEINSLGLNWRDTIDSIDGRIVESSKAYLKAGASIEQLAQFYGLTADQAKALEKAVKFDDEVLKANLEGYKNWVEGLDKKTAEFLKKTEENAKIYLDEAAKADDAVAKSSMTSGEYQRYQIEQTRVKAHDAVKATAGDAKIAYDAIDRAAQVALDNLSQDWTTLNSVSKKQLQEIADKAMITYQYMKDHSADFSAHAIQNAKDVADAAQDSANGVEHSWRQAFNNIITDIPKLLEQAFTGGGGIAGAAKAIGVMLASEISKPILDKLSKTMGQAVQVGSGIASGVGGQFGGTAGAIIGSAAGTIGGAVVGSAIAGSALAGTTAGAVALGAATAGIGLAAVGAYLALKHLFSLSADYKAAKEAQQTLIEQLQSMATDAEKSQGALTDNYHTIAIVARDAFLATGMSADEAEKKVAALLNTKDKKQFADALAELGKAIKWSEDVTTGIDAVSTAFGKAGSYIPVAMKDTIKSMLSLNTLTDAQRTKLQGLLDSATPSFENLMGIADKYGITLEQLGPKFQQSDLDGKAKQIYEDFMTLTDAGADSNGVLAGMSDKIQGLINDSKKFGTAIPDNMKPLIQQLIDSGKLFDENGQKIVDMTDIKFGPTPLNQGLEDLNKTLKDLILTLGGVPGAITAINNTHPAPIHIPIVYDRDPANSEGMSAGGLVGAMHLANGAAQIMSFTPTGTDTQPAMLTPGERVLSPGENRDFEKNSGQNAMANFTESVAGLKSELAGMRRDFTFVLPGLIAKATTVGMAKSGKR